MALITLSALFSGLTLGLFSLDTQTIKILGRVHGIFD